MREHMDPQLARIAQMMPVVDLSDVQKIRSLNMDTKMPVSASDRGVRATDVWVPRRKDGGTQIRVRVYQPHEPEQSATPARPAILYCHPGLFFGTLEMDHARCMRFAAEVGCIVVSVDYRLAPEFPFPCGLDDCHDVLAWMASPQAGLGVDPERIAVAGCSTGATLAASLALLVRDRGERSVAFQLLVCPTLDDRLDTPSMHQFREPAAMEAGRVGSEYTWRYYLGEARGDVSPYAAPARATELAGLPPALVVTAEYDCTRDEGIEYALRLVRAGVPCELHHFPGCFHAFDFVARTAAISRRALDEQIAVLQRALGSAPHPAQRSATIEAPAASAE